MNRRSFISWISSLCVVLPWKSRKLPPKVVLNVWHTKTQQVDGLTEIIAMGSSNVRGVGPDLPTGFVRVHQSWQPMEHKKSTFIIKDREIRR